MTKEILHLLINYFVREGYTKNIKRIAMKLILSTIHGAFKFVIYIFCELNLFYTNFVIFIRKCDINNIHVPV